MEQNNFEKHIQSELGELKIPPSDAVWGHIEKRLTKKKKDRKILLVFFFLFLSLLSGGYWLLEQGHPDAQQNLLVRKQESRSGIKINSAESDRRRERDSGAGKINPGPIKNGNLLQSGSSPSPRVLSHPTPLRVHPKAGKEIAYQPDLIPSPSSAAKSDRDQKGNTEQGITAGHRPANPSGNGMINSGVVKPDEHAVPSLPGHMLHKIKEDSVRQMAGADMENTNASGPDTAQKKRSSHRKERWTPEIFLSGGTSMLGKLPQEFNSPASYTQANYPGTPSVYAVPSKMRNAAAFSAGILFEKNISSRNKISLGLSYTYYSLVGKVGHEIDSAAYLYNSGLPASEKIYSASGNEHTYHNQFHFVEIPVSVKFQIGHNQQTPLYWVAGINISQLIGSNAVQFQPNPGIYYTDNRLLDKSQFGLHTGFSLTLLADKKNPLTVGPYFYYSITRIADTGLYQGQHFSFIGLKASLLFPKK